MLEGVIRFFFVIGTVVNAQNECSDTVHKDLWGLAKRGPTYMQDSVALCDRYLVKGWYVALHHAMPTTAPGLGFCGTTYPYWLDDTLPETQGTTKNVKVCQVGFEGPCSRSHMIWVTNCGTFFVYELIPLDICASAYCFEKNTSCVDEVPPQPSVAYHGVTWQTTNGAFTLHEPDVNLVCQIDRLSDNSLFYDVTWYVDDTEILSHQTVSSKTSDLALLKGTQILAKGKKANSMVHCIVGAKVKVSDVPCKTVSSSLFFAGIKVLNPTLIIPRGGHKDIQLQFTIPFINQHGIIGTLETQPYLGIAMDIHNSSSDCRDDNRNTCETKVYAYKKQDTDRYDTDDWKVIHNVRVYNKDDNDFTIQDKHITLRLKTGGTNGVGSRLFEKLTLPDIQVYIEDTDSSWKGAYCGSHTDPHMKTFDGKNYECQLDGTFVLYRNEHFQQEVQEKHHLCYPAYSYPRCSCAVAVRSGRDVFVVDICNSKSIIHFPSCGDRILKVIKTNDRYYKVILPTGTLVEIKFVSWPTQNNWQLNIDIYPSPSDVRKSSGLCGILDGNYRNDFTRRDGTVDNPDNYHYSNPPNDFSESWRVNDELDLFNQHMYKNLMSISGVLDRVCTCKRDGTNAQTGTIECTYGTYKECKFVVGKKFHCILNPEGQLRRKRDIRHLENLYSGTEIEYETSFMRQRQKRETAPSVKTYEEAAAVCNTAFQASSSYQTCQEYVTDLSNTSLVNCISDVMMTGDDNFTRIHIEAALEQCSIFVVLNTTFQQTEPEVTYTIETFCQNNCSGHGICNGGNCTCNEGYAGSDCSFDLLGPPTISHISDFGFCDKSKETCDDITLFGKYFIENMNTNCFMTRHTLRKDGSFVSVANYVVGLEERTLFEGFCPLEYENIDHWVTEFSFNISNDGSRFTENFHVYTYQSLCQEYQNDTGNITFVFKDGYCFINNTCVADGSANTNNECDICNTSRSKHEWSYNEGHCFISGVCFKSGDFNGTNPCSICDPSVDTTAWTPNTELCFIDDICYGNGQTQMNKGCHVCKPNISISNWTLENGSCLIDGMCYNTNDVNNSDSCSICDPSVNTSSWSPNLSCTSTLSNEPTTTQSEPTTKILDTTLITTLESTISTTDPTTSTREHTTTTSESTTTQPKPTTTQELTTTTQRPSTTTIEHITSTLEPTTATPEQTATTTPELTTSIPDETSTTKPEPTTRTHNPTTTTLEPTTTTTIEQTITTLKPTTTTPEPTTSIREPTTTTSKPTTLTQEPTTTTKPKPTTTTTPELTTATMREPTTTTPALITTSQEPTTTMREPITTTPGLTTTTQEPTTTTQEPITTTQEPTTITPERTTTITLETTTTTTPGTTNTTSPKPTTTTQEPTTTTPEPTTSTPDTTITTPEPTTTRPEPTTTIQEPTTTTQKPTTTPVPTTTQDLTTTTTPKLTTTTPEPTTSTLEPTTTRPQTTTTIQEPTTTTTPEPTTTTPKPTTFTQEPSTSTQVHITSTQPNCITIGEDVSVVYYNVSWISTNETNSTTTRTIHDPYINFKCMFDMPQNTTTSSTFFKIWWYVDNVTLIKTVTVSEADIDQATLSSKDLPPLNQTAGIEIHCAVAASILLASENCERSTSPSFFAGMKVNETYHNILRKGKTVLLMYLTIPYVTRTFVENGQIQQLPALAVHPFINLSTSACRGLIGLDKCVIEFKPFSFNERYRYNSNGWKQNQTLVMHHVDTDGYEIDQSLTVQLKTRTNGNTFWNNFNQNISITITDFNGVWKGKSCGSKTDPHMHTFDGVFYENHINGEFILYRNTLFNQEVQTRHKQCHPDYNFPHCTCAVSIQSGQDIFLVDLCEDIQFVDFLSCNDSTIEVYKISDKLYKINLPTGTYVMVSLVEWPIQGSWQIDIDIYPSLSDVNNTEGLCGTLDGDRENDFTRRIGSIDNVNLVYPDDFSNSWKVLGDENLLKEPLRTRHLISSSLDKICLCTPKGGQCSYNTHCSNTVGKKFLCTEPINQVPLSRKKRDVSLESIISPSLQSAKSLTRKRRDVVFNTSTTRENAETVCMSAFERSGPYKTCQEYVSDLSNASISNCINDVIMTSDYNITAIHVEAALQQCVTFVGLNTTLQNANPAVTTSLQKLCPSNCSGHGFCDEGNCSCEVGFGGSDCSFDILSPPVIWESTPNGTCDRSLHQCSTVYFKGRYFLENVDKHCFITKQSIHHDGSMLDLKEVERPLVEENLFMGSCSLPGDDVTSWVTKYTFSVSYDRKQFTQTFSFYTYQSQCQQHSVQNGNDKFTLKEGYCFIDNACVQGTVTNPKNRCKLCNPDKNNYQWSGKQDCESTTTVKPPDSSASTLVYIVTASVLSLLFVAAVVVIIGVWKYQRSKQYRDSGDDEDTEYRTDVVSKSWMRFFDDGKFPYIPRGSRFSTRTYSSPETKRF